MPVTVWQEKRCPELLNEVAGDEGVQDAAARSTKPGSTIWQEKRCPELLKDVVGDEGVQEVAARLTNPGSTVLQRICLPLLSNTPGGLVGVHEVAARLTINVSVVWQEMRVPDPLKTPAVSVQLEAARLANPVLLIGQVTSTVTLAGDVVELVEQLATLVGVGALMPPPLKELSDVVTRESEVPTEGLSVGVANGTMILT